jgi:predicted neutral ceramidase superfamily lipid hydrolase
VLIAQYDLVDNDEIEEINEEIYRASPKVTPKKGFSEGFW